MSIAIDFGASRFRALRRQEDRLIGRQTAAVYVSVPDQPAQRRLLQQADVQFIPCDDALIVLGDAATDVAESLSLPTIPALPSGVLPPSDPLGRQVVAALAESIIPVANHKGEPCAFVAPGGVIDPNDPGLNFVSRILRLLDYEPIVMNPAHALVLAEMGDQQFTGVGLSLGESVSVLAVTHRGRMVACRSLALGSESIDRQIAEQTNRFLHDADGNRYLDLNAVRQWKAELNVPLSECHSNEEQRLAELVAKQLSIIGHELSRLLSSEACRGIFSESGVTLTTCGGTAKLPGLVELVGRVFRRNEALAAIDHLRICPDECWTVARGCLVAAEIESQSIRHSSSLSDAA